MYYRMPTPEPSGYVNSVLSGCVACVCACVRRKYTTLCRADAVVKGWASIHVQACVCKQARYSGLSLGPGWSSSE